MIIKRTPLDTGVYPIDVIGLPTLRVELKSIDCLRLPQGQIAWHCKRVVKSRSHTVGSNDEDVEHVWGKNSNSNHNMRTTKTTVVSASHGGANYCCSLFVHVYLCPDVFDHFVVKGNLFGRWTTSNLTCERANKRRRSRFDHCCCAKRFVWLWRSF